MTKRNKKDLIGSISGIAGISLALYTLIRHGKSLYVFLSATNSIKDISFFVNIGLIILGVYLLVRSKSTEKTTDERFATLEKETDKRIVVLEKKIEPMAEHVKEMAKSLKNIERVFIEKAINMKN
jgi:uncharacterized protein YoxC